MSRRKKSPEPASEGAPEWMLTYSDLVTLLLCFFILLYSMAVLDKQKFSEVAFSLRSSFNHVSSGDKFNTNKGEAMISITPFDQGEELIESLEQFEDIQKQAEESEEATASMDEKEKEAVQRKEEIKEAKDNLQNLINELGLNENIKVLDEKGSVILRIDSLILFDSGSAELKVSGKPVMEKLGTILKTLDTEILVQGHADDRPIHTTLFPSNWELSTKRATNVIKYLVDASKLDPKYLTGTGNAEFKPIVPNDTEYNRQKNRRIDIIILK